MISILNASNMFYLKALPSSFSSIVHNALPQPKLKVSTAKYILQFRKRSLTETYWGVYCTGVSNQKIIPGKAELQFLFLFLTIFGIADNNHILGSVTENRAMCCLCHMLP